MIFVLPYERPLLTSNKRMAWQVEHRHKSDIRQSGYIQARKYMLDNPGTYPLPYLADICMTWQVPTRHRRDADAAQPTLKSWVDGITNGTAKHPGAGLLYDDSWIWVSRMYCRIEYKPGEPMKLTVEIVEASS